MRGCASLFSLTLLLAGCGQPQGDFGFRIAAVQLSPGYQKIQARFEQDLSFSREAVEALEHGVTLTVTLDMELRDAATLTLLSEHEEHYQIRYLPLSERYQLSGGQNPLLQTYPRLRHALAALGTVDADFRTGALAPGRYEFRTRVYLDPERMPAPMRLPALLSPQWRHDSDWTTWPFQISA